MAYYKVKGGNEISGEVFVKGSKNATLPILVASLLVEDEVVLDNCPFIEDVEDTINILKYLGCKVKREGRALTICSKNVENHEIPVDLACKMRSSILFLGALLGRENKCVVPSPGGCIIGKRPIDMHLKSFEKMGVVIEEDEENECFSCHAQHILGYHIYLDYPSVGATENILLLAVKAKGVTVIHNPAKEPEIIALVQFLRSCGGEIYGEGTDRIMVEGVKKLHGTYFQLPFDRIQCGTFMCASAMTKGEIFLKGVDCDGIEPICYIMENLGCSLSWEKGGLWCKAPKYIKSNVKIITGPHPKFPTDMQPLIVSLLTLAQGTCIIQETVFEDRFAYVSELCKMGGNICVEDNIAVIKGNNGKKLIGCEVFGKDLRGGMALVLAGLCAEGESKIHGVEFIQRGYEDVEKTFKSLGGEVSLIL